MVEAATRVMVDDLSRHAAEEMQETLNRHMRVIQGVLPPAECLQVLLTLANGVALGAMGYALQMRREGQDPEDLWATIAAAMPCLLEAGKPAVWAYVERAGQAG